MAEVAKLPVSPDRLQITFPLDDVISDGAVIRPLSFSSFVECVLSAQQMTQPASFEARLKRVRMLKQVSFFAGNAPVPMTEAGLLRMPIPVARKILAQIDSGEGLAGKVLREGDGIEKAIVYELGTPIPVGQGKPPIKELEFHASTYGDIEDVLAVEMMLQQTLIMIQTIAKPLGTSLSLLPSWAVNAITVADGVIISQKVLPSFLESPEG